MYALMSVSEQDRSAIDVRSWFPSTFRVDPLVNQALLFPPLTAGHKEPSPRPQVCAEGEGLGHK